MKTKLTQYLLATLLGAAFTAELHAQTTAFTYQGQLMDNGQPATGLYDLSFHLYDAPTNGNEAVTALGFSSWPVTNGLFTAQLDFGQDVFTGQQLWLQIEARSPSDTVWEPLSPRQLLTPAPYAIHALTVDASGLRGAISSTNFAPGTLDGRVLGDNSVSSLKILDGAIQPVDLDAGSFNETFWKANGNAGTTPGTDFIGTTDNQPLEFRVNGMRSLRIEPHSNGAPNLIGGAPVNNVDPGIAGATIAVSGGGSQRIME